MAPNIDTGHLGLIKCTYKHCDERFDTVKDMQRHKRYYDDHNYCKKCDVDCDDWEDFLAHKIDAMQTWMDNRGTDDCPPQPKHITCEFCGHDSKTLGGRREHVDQMHQAFQHINCPGCSVEFGRPAEFIEHLESGHCPHISISDFMGNIKQKHVIKQIMENPEAFMENLKASKAFVAAIENPGQIDDDEDGHDDSDGHLLEGTIDGTTTRSRQSSRLPSGGKGNWPRLPNQQLSSLTDAVRNLSMASHPSDTAGISITDRVNGNGFRSGGIQLPVESSMPALHPTPPRSSGSDEENDDDVDSNASDAGSDTDGPSAWGTGQSSNNNSALQSPDIQSATVYPSAWSSGQISQSPWPGTSSKSSLKSPANAPSVWANGRSARALFQSQTPSPTSATTSPATPGDWAHILKSRTAHSLGTSATSSLPDTPSWQSTVKSSVPSPTDSEQNNLLHHHFWDPNHKDYQPDLFFNISTNHFYCPFADCSTTEYTTLNDVETHIRLSHTRRQFRCPLCLKVYRLASSLVAHASNPAGRCRVRESNAYMKLIDEISGGYLKVKPIKWRPDVCSDKKKKLVLNGRVVDGVAKQEYTAKMPNER